MSQVEASRGSDCVEADCDLRLFGQKRQEERCVPPEDPRFGIHVTPCKENAQTNTIRKEEKPDLSSVGGKKIQSGKTRRRSESMKSKSRSRSGPNPARQSPPQGWKVRNVNLHVNANANFPPHAEIHACTG